MNENIVEENAKYVEEQFGIPKEKYIEICEKFSQSSKFIRLMNQNALLKTKIASGFAFGLIVGYLLKGKEEEKISKFLV